MSVDVIIRQKGLFRKPLALQPVTGGELRCLKRMKSLT